MGVLGLWEVLDSVGHPIKVEALEGKVLGVDANIWLYKFIRGFREKDNASNIESHKLGLFNRVSKLLYYRIKPVFVFDGPAPVLKRRTLERRQNTRNKHLLKVQDAALKILASQLKNQYPDAKIDDLKITMPNLVSNNLVAAEKLTEEDRNLFYMPEMAKTDNDDDSDDDSDFAADIFNPQEFMPSDVDIQSNDFSHLPPETRYEILHDIKQSRKRIRNPNHLPEDANSFSNFQLERLKARRKIQEKIEECEKEICTNYTGELADGSSIQAFRVHSDARATILYRNNTYDPKLLEANDKEISVKDERESIKVDEKVEDITTSKSSSISDYLKKTPTKVPQLGPRFKTNSKMLLEPDTGFLSDESTDDEEPTAKTLAEPSQPTSQPQPGSSTLGSLSSKADIRSSPGQVEVISSDDTSDESLATVLSHEFNEPTEKLSREIGCDNTEFANRTVIDLTDLADNNNVNTTITIDSSLDESSSSSIDEPVEKTLVESPSKRDGGEGDSIHYAVDHEEPLGDLGKLTSFKPSSQPDQVQEGSPDETNVEHHVERVASETKLISEPSSQANPSSRLPTEPSRPHEIPHSSQNSQPLNASQNTKSSQVNSQQFSLSQSSRDGPNVTNKVTNKIIEDAKELLRLFGIPYIDAAGEAEAQCAKLEELKLTQGTITDDSDIWLFGAQNVYRHFFSDDKYVMQYKMTDIEFHVRLTRENLVCFAMLVGSDYTDGIMNVGSVTALELLSEFPGDGMDPLAKFTEWHREAVKDVKAARKEKSRKNFLKFRLPDEFPSRAVYEGYLRPVADSSTEKFAWGVPELDELREYARRNFGWDPKKVDDKLVPVMKRLHEKKLQQTIDSFFFKTEANRNPEMFRSKRVNQALNKIAKRAARGGDKVSVPEVVNLSEDES